MDDGDSFTNRHWGYFAPPPTRSLALQLMSNVTLEHDTKPFMNQNVGFLRDNIVPQPPGQLDYHYPGHSFLHSRDNKFMHGSVGYNSIFPDSPEPIEEEKAPVIRRRSQANPRKPKKPRKLPSPENDDEDEDGSVPKPKAEKKSNSVMINGYDLDFSEIPTPVCSCTGAPQPCYRWGIGGWQSACCTISISQHPLPLSSKKKGARIAGRKMSQGAFKKVLERLSGEGYDLSTPIDLKMFWAKHGTNKFVTIR